MARYDYQCTLCEHTFEVIHTAADPPALSCPECGGLVRRKPSFSARVLSSAGDKAKEAATQEKAACGHHHPEGTSCYGDQVARELMEKADEDDEQ